MRSALLESPLLSLRRVVVVHVVPRRSFRLGSGAFRGGWVKKRRPPQDVWPGLWEQPSSWRHGGGREDQQWEQQWQGPPDPSRNARKVLWTILGLNVSVYLMWKAAEASGDRKRVQFMMDHFT